MRVLENIEPKSVLRFFEEISKIPRGSGKEKTVSDYIRNWAEGLELEVQQDEDYNLIVKKPATPGRESREPVIIQSHMDMVCEKTGDSNHDFERDPILLKIEGDEISSAVGTTLGADNGIGMALSMALLEDDTVKNPPWKSFTVRKRWICEPRSLRWKGSGKKLSTWIMLWIMKSLPADVAVKEKK